MRRNSKINQNLKKNLKTYEQQITNLRKHKLMKPLKSLATIWIHSFFISISICTNSTKNYTELIKKFN